MSDSVLRDLGRTFDQLVVAALAFVLVSWLAVGVGGYALGVGASARQAERAIETAEGYRTELVALMERCEAAAEANRTLIEWAGP